MSKSLTESNSSIATPLSATNIDISNLKCKEHPNRNIEGICINSKCKENNKLICFKCVTSIHNKHVELSK